MTFGGKDDFPPVGIPDCRAEMRGDKKNKKNWHQLSYSFQRKGPVTHEINIGIALSNSELSFS